VRTGSPPTNTPGGVQARARARRSRVHPILAAREQRAAAAKRLGEAFEKLDALNLPPFPEEEIEAEVQAARQARRRGHFQRAATPTVERRTSSGDRRDLLPLASYEGIPIVTAREARDRLALQN
jgi:hypothetical protein